MSSTALDQDLRPRTARNLCIETAPAGFVTAGIVSAGVITGQWWIYLVALIPVSAAARHAYRTISNELRYALTRWLIAEARSRRRQVGVLELEDTDTKHRPTIVNSTIVEPTS